MRLLVPYAVIALIGTAVALGEPNGPLYSVTDMAPFCATCHSSTSLVQFPDLRPEVAATEIIEEKHLKQIQTSPAYKELTAAERQSLINAVKWADEQAAVTMKAPAQAKRNSSIEVTVTTRGGAGPVIGLSLVDSVIRYQARPIGSSGFKVLGPPIIIGPNGKAQTNWIERRVRGSDLGLSTAIIAGIRGNAETQHVDVTRTTWTLRAPADPGTYEIAAVFYYGTEKTHPLGIVVRNGRVEPRGGANGGSGRVMFSDSMKINVN
jgi:hypothetical protein